MLDTMRRVLGYQLTIAQSRSRGGVDRAVAGAAVLERVHDMTAKAAGILSMPGFTYLGSGLI